MHISHAHYTNATVPYPCLPFVRGLHRRVFLISMLLFVDLLCPDCYQEAEASGAIKMRSALHERQCMRGGAALHLYFCFVLSCAFIVVLGDY